MESDQNILIDKLEDQLIDNPDASTTEQLRELSYDETFQKKLNERADLFLASGSSNTNGRDPDRSSFFHFMVTKPILDYTHRDYGPIHDELSMWFVSQDFTLLDLDNLPSKLAPFDLSRLPELPTVDVRDESVILDSMLYFVLGNYRNCRSKPAQLDTISRNCNDLLAKNAMAYVAPLLISAMDLVNRDTMVSSILQRNYLILLTIAYFILCVALHTSGPDDVLLDTLLLLDLMCHVFVFIDKWRLLPKNASRIRNVILLMWKLVLVEFGDSLHLLHVHDYLNEAHHIPKHRRKASSDNRLVCSPLDLLTFREDMLGKYPVSFSSTDCRPHAASPEPSSEEQAPNEPTPAEAVSSDFYTNFMALDTYSSSLSNLLMAPHTNKDHSILGQLPVQTLHIATPVPSPPQTPSDFLSGGEKVRRLYHVNQGMPFVYPQEENKPKLPEAVKEASTIFENAVYESFSIKRLWTERQRYMAQERGFRDQYSVEDDDEDYSDDLHDRRKRSLHRVEEVYSRSLLRLPSLVKVLVKIIKSSEITVSLKDFECEVDPATSFASKYCDEELTTYEKLRTVMLRQLETIKAKENTLVASSSLLILLLRWFKESHVVKSYYLSSLIFDEQYFRVLVDFLTNSFNNSNLQDFENNNKKNLSPYDVVSSQNRLMNPRISIEDFDFFNRCLGIKSKIHRIELINKTPTSSIPSTVDANNANIVHITKFNETFAHILVNLLQVANKVLVKNVSQRAFVLNETKPTDLLKVVLQNFINDSLRMPILKMFKKLIPYQGRKWRAMNMEVISQIFLHLKLSLRDNWLSGKDLEKDFNNSFDQEIALRSLLQFYNIRRYPEEMRKLGFVISTENIPTFDFDLGC